MLNTALTIAGSDSSGASGIQADLRTFLKFGILGTSVITSVTSQSINSISNIHNIPENSISSQIDAICKKFKISSFKTGMLGESTTVTAVEKKIKEHSLLNFVLDPVILSSSNVKLLTDEALENLIKNLLPLSYLITPNIPEAQKLSGIKIENIEDMKKAAEKIFKLGSGNVLIKGGHLKENDPIDILYDGETYKTFESKRIDKDMRGTGCMLSSAIVANLANKKSLIESIKNAKDFIFNTITESHTINYTQKEPLNSNLSVNLGVSSGKTDNILKNLEDAANELKRLKMGSLIPEIQSNMSYAKPNAKNIEEVAAFPGRIIKAEDNVYTVEPPGFGASRHIAKIVLTSMKYDKTKRSCMNIRFSKGLVLKLKALKLTVYDFDRLKEPKEIKAIEGSTLEWGTESVIKKAGFVPDIIYDKGDFGKEPVIRIIAKNPNEIVKIIEKIL